MQYNKHCQIHQYYQIIHTIIENYQKDSIYNDACNDMFDR